MREKASFPTWSSYKSYDNKKGPQISERNGRV